jgi:hypothetical protein
VLKPVKYVTYFATGLAASLLYAHLRLAGHPAATAGAAFVLVCALGFTLDWFLNRRTGRRR